MRAALSLILLSFLAGCASTPVNSAWTTVDHKNNVIRQTQRTQSEFVGTSAAVATPVGKQPSWYKWGHP